MSNFPIDNLSSSSRADRLLVNLIYLALIYPVFAIFVVHVEWLLGWYSLGHPPIPSMDDPKFIEGSSWMHPLTGVILGGLYLFFLVTPVLATILGFRQSSKFAVLTLLCYALGFVGLIGMCRWDPLQVMEWWFD